VICGEEITYLSMGQNTHQDLVKKFGLLRILFDEQSFHKRIFITNLAYGACFSSKIIFLIILRCI